MFRTIVVCCLSTIFIYKCVVTKENKFVRNDVIGLDFKDALTINGLVRGQRAEDGDYFAFLGIPYAAPPIGKRRFKAPLPPAPWDGIFQANKTVKCPQFGEGDEDCLILNVFTPNIVNGPLPVLVYIHGGSFLMGTGQTKGVEPLMKQNIIVVTINYRLGALGFLCLGIKDAPGNAGLKDQIAALKWVKSNIGYFGGDPDNVTVYGMSAGGASVELLALSKMSRGLFQKAMIESGTATAVWTTDASPISTALNVAAALKFPGNIKNVRKLADYYQQVPADHLSQVNFEYYSNLTDGSFGFVPCVERKVFGEEPFLTDSPYNIIKQENYHKIPLMLIFASLEGLYLRSSEYYEHNYKERMESNFLDFLPADLVFDTEEIRNEIGGNVKQFYFGNRPIGNDTLIEYLNYFGDYLVLHGILNSAQIHSKGDNPVYLMEFGYKGRLGSEETFYESIKIAGHGDVIKHAILNKPVQDENDEIIVERISKLIANFVKFGDPTPDQTELLPLRWPPVQPNNVSCLYVGENIKIVEEPYWGRKVFWDNLYSKFRRPIRPVNPNIERRTARLLNL